MDMPHTNRRTAFASIAVLAALLAACQSSGHRRVDATSTRLDQMRASLDQLESELKSTADSLAVVVEHADSGPEAALTQFKKDVKAVDASYGHARARLTEAETEASKLFETWTKNASLISDPDLRALSEKRRDELKAALDSVTARMQEAVSEMEDFVSTSRDLVTYLDQDLTPEGVRALADKSRVHSERAASIAGLFDAVEQAAAEAAPMFATAKPPTAPKS
jgi:chromosome segregation ATPase